MSDTFCCLFQFANLIILLTQVLYRYIPNVWIVFAIVFFEGLLGGGAYVNTFYKMSKEVRLNTSCTLRMQGNHLTLQKTGPEKFLSVGQCKQSRFKPQLRINKLCDLFHNVSLPRCVVFVLVQ